MSNKFYEKIFNETISLSRNKFHGPYDLCKYDMEIGSQFWKAARVTAIL